MKFFTVLALATAAFAATPNADPNADANAHMDINAQPQAAPMAQAAGNSPQGHWPPYPPPPPPPPPQPQNCRPGTYSCTVNRRGWRVCDYSGRWTYAGACPWNTQCRYNWQSASPYCI